MICINKLYQEWHIMINQDWKELRRDHFIKNIMREGTTDEM